MNPRRALISSCFVLVIGCGGNRTNVTTSEHAVFDGGGDGELSMRGDSRSAIPAGETFSVDGGSSRSPAFLEANAKDAGVPRSCEWVGLSDARAKLFRVNAHRLLDEFAPGETPNAISCCFLNDSDALCRTRSYKTASPRDYRYAVYTRLVGVSTQDNKAWFDAPVEVADYKTMKQVNPPWDLELTLTVQGATFSLQEMSGKCPRKCSASQGGCKKWEVQAERACRAVGRYERITGDLVRK